MDLSLTQNWVRNRKWDQSTQLHAKIKEITNDLLNAVGDLWIKNDEKKRALLSNNIVSVWQRVVELKNQEEGLGETEEMLKFYAFKVSIKLMERMFRIGRMFKNKKPTTPLTRESFLLWKCVTDPTVNHATFLSQLRTVKQHESIYQQFKTAAHYFYHFLFDGKDNCYKFLAYGSGSGSDSTIPFAPGLDESEVPVVPPMEEGGPPPPAPLMAEDDVQDTEVKRILMGNTGPKAENKKRAENIPSGDILSEMKNFKGLKKMSPEEKKKLEDEREEKKRAAKAEAMGAKNPVGGMSLSGLRVALQKRSIGINSGASNTTTRVADLPPQLVVSRGSQHHVDLSKDQDQKREAKLDESPFGVPLRPPSGGGGQTPARRGGRGGKTPAGRGGQTPAKPLPPWMTPFDVERKERLQRERKEKEEKERVAREKENQLRAEQEAAKKDKEKSDRERKNEAGPLDSAQSSESSATSSDKDSQESAFQRAKRIAEANASQVSQSSRPAPKPKPAPPVFKQLTEEEKEQQAQFAREQEAKRKADAEAAAKERLRKKALGEEWDDDDPGREGKDNEEQETGVDTTDSSDSSANSSEASSVPPSSALDNPNRERAEQLLRQREELQDQIG